MSNSNTNTYIIYIITYMSSIKKNSFLFTDYKPNTFFQFTDEKKFFHEEDNEKDKFFVVSFSENEKEDLKSIVYSNESNQYNKKTVDEIENNIDFKRTVKSIIPSYSNCYIKYSKYGEVHSRIGKYGYSDTYNM